MLAPSGDQSMAKGLSVQRKVTIEDIARQSGVSRTTVSLVLRDKPGIGTETRARVWTAARSLGYQRRLPAPVETGQAVLNVGLILRSRFRERPDGLPGVNNFYTWVLAGAEAAARQARMNLIYTTLPVDQNNEAVDFPDHLLGQRLDGILLVGSFSEATIAEVADRGSTPIVLVDAPAGTRRHDLVASDNTGGAYIATKQVIERGHRKTAFVGPDQENDPNFSQRREGYLKALREHRLEPFSARMPRGDVMSATEELLRRHPEITALIGCNDIFAIDAMQAAQALGRNVPDDLSIVGFDDMELATQVAPALTTMAVDKVTMGRLAVQSLAYRLAWPEAAVFSIVLQAKLVERASVATLSCAAADDS
jgi:DNA-binding LacI/PurR family transcriptional regulator